jgi:hypothetical protein
VKLGPLVRRVTLVRLAKLDPQVRLELLELLEPLVRRVTLV